jgi:hypothetical protein
MRSALRVGLITLGSLLATLIVTPLLIWQFRDHFLKLPSVQERILQQAEAMIGIRPEWDGILEIRWRPSESGVTPMLGTLQFTLGAGAIPNPPGFSKAPLLAWEQVTAVVTVESLRQLIRQGDVGIQSLNWQNVMLLADYNAQGLGNWEYLLANTASGNRSALRIDDLSVSTLQWRFRDTSGTDIASHIGEVQLDALAVDDAGRGGIESLVVRTPTGFELDARSIRWSDRPDGAPTLRALWRLQDLSLRDLALPAWLADSNTPLLLSQAEGALSYRPESPPPSQEPGLSSSTEWLIQIDLMQLDDISLSGVLRGAEHWEIKLQLGTVRLDPYLARLPAGASNSPNLAVDASLMGRPIYGQMSIDELVLDSQSLRGVVLRLRP